MENQDSRFRTGDKYIDYSGKCIELSKAATQHGNTEKARLYNGIRSNLSSFERAIALLHTLESESSSPKNPCIQVDQTKQIGKVNRPLFASASGTTIPPNEAQVNGAI